MLRSFLPGEAGYFLSIFGFMLVASVRLGLLAFAMAQNPPPQLPLEVKVWMAAAATFPVGLHVLAGVAEFRTNRTRRKLVD
jgi:hypothetical protein